MTNEDDNKYLAAVLAAQNLEDKSQELKDLQTRRAEVEEVLRKHFKDSMPTIRYGGSKAKGTLIREAYDLDIVCYFPRDDQDAGGTLRDIYSNVKAAVIGTYRVEEKTSALRLRAQDYTDFHIDLVPGRFIDEKMADCFLYQASSDKERLKTNLDVHIAHVKDSGVVEVIRLLKLWKARKALEVKQFVFELAIINLLKDGKKLTLADQLTTVLSALRDRTEPVGIEDPANSGNDVSGPLKQAWPTLSQVARATLEQVEAGGWKAIFGDPDGGSGGGDKVARVSRATAAVSTPSKPWSE